MKIVQMLPEGLREIVMSSGIPEAELREIRLRVGRGLIIETADGEKLLAKNGRSVRLETEAYRVTKEDIKTVLELFTGYSVYAFEEELRQGYFTVEGGHRIGVAGRAVTENGRVLRMNYISFLNIRIAHECRNCSRELYNRLYGENRLYHTMIFAPAGCGKTTFLRDLIRLLSESGTRVGVADERSELAASHHGIPQHDLGGRTDVMDGCPKAEAMQMLLRSMTPQVLAADEIGLPEDVLAIRAAAGSGCKVLASAHGGTLSEIQKNPMLRELWEERRFERYVRLEKSKKGFGIKAIYDAEGVEL
ncbi:MAG: stage III sporulation protein AA [Lachnospiraceae bacterium]|nr:stage III sporulation protein AA [Lachnospiraceae bacterium]